MTSSVVETAQAVSVSIDEDTLTIELADGRSVAVPVAWYPRLSHATQSERANWQLIANGLGIRWPDLDEDIEVAAVLDGKRSGEAQASLRKWLEGRSRVPESGAADRQSS